MNPAEVSASVVHRPGQTTVALRINIGQLVLLANPEGTKQVHTVLTRLQTKLQKSCKKGGIETPVLSFEDDQSHPVDPTLPISELTHCFLRVDKCAVPLLYNPPTVLEIYVPGSAMVGCPILPVVTLEHASGVEYIWRRVVTDDASLWPELARTKCYYPAEEDLGHVLCVDVVPVGAVPCIALVRTFTGTRYTQQDGVPAVPCTATSMVRPRNTTGFYHIRHQHISTCTPSTGCRVVTYNLLANYNLNQEIQRGGDIYFGQFEDKPSELCFEHRRQVLLEELVGYKADILMLQEVDRQVMYADYLHPHFNSMGYGGVYANKMHTTTPIGQAVFWNKERYELVFERQIDLTRPIKQRGVDPAENPRFSPVGQFIQDNESIMASLSKTTSVANIVMLRPLDEQMGPALCLCNNHFFGEPAAPHIRLLQVALVLEHCGNAIAAAKGHHGIEQVALVVGGDFNARDDESLCRFLQTGHVSSEDKSWDSTATYRWAAFNWVDGSVVAAKPQAGGERAAMELVHGFQLANSVVGHQPYTWMGHVREFGRESMVCVDHMFYDTNLMKVSSILPSAPREFVEEYAAPSSRFASDHVAVVVDFKFVA